jgi:DNA-binding NarL/FixJ family response regulator
MVVNHIDGDKTNNNIGNLEYVTPSQNNKHTHAMGRGKVVNGHIIARYSRENPGEGNPRSKLTNQDVLRVRELRSRGQTYKVIASKFNVSEGAILKIVRRMTWMHL